MKTEPVTPALLRPATACQYLGFGRTKLHELEKFDPDFPRKIKLSPRCVGWTRDQLDGWLKLKTEQATKGVA